MPQVEKYVEFVKQWQAVHGKAQVALLASTPLAMYDLDPGAVGGMAGGMAQQQELLQMLQQVGRVAMSRCSTPACNKCLALHFRCMPACWLTGCRVAALLLHSLVDRCRASKWTTSRWGSCGRRSTPSAADDAWSCQLASATAAIAAALKESGGHSRAASSTGIDDGIEQQMKRGAQ